MRYDLHTHTTFSDGRDSVWEMARAADAVGIVFGNTVMGRFSLFIGRLDFLILQNPLTIPIAAKALLVMALACGLFFLAYLSVRGERQKQGAT
ncbi:MAG: hypothetical protein HZLCBSQH_001910 [Candidatus Fervidibacterota bacterium]